MCNTIIFLYYNYSVGTTLFDGLDGIMYNDEEFGECKQFGTIRRNKGKLRNYICTHPSIFNKTFIRN